MKIAYFIATYKLEQQFEWLFKAIWNPNDIFVIHISQIASGAHVDAIRRITAGKPNVHFLPRMQITWGGWSLVEMALNAVRFLCLRPEGWQYFINLSGQDYPVRPLDDLRSLLAERAGTNFLQMRHISTQPFHIRRRLHWYCLEHAGQLRRLPIPNVRAMLTPVEWYGGFWGMLTREFCEWLVTSDVTKKYSRALRHTKIPDEFFFQTIIKQSPFAATLDGNPRRYLRFEPGASGPKTLTCADLDDIMASKAFFARKLDESIDVQLLELLAEAIKADMPQRDRKPAAPMPRVAAHAL